MVSNLQMQLRASGIFASEIGLYGRFHVVGCRSEINPILEFCDNHPAFHLPDASSLVMPTRSNQDGSYIMQGALHYQALCSILVEPPQWFRAFTTVHASNLKPKDATLISFGLERCVPPSLIGKLNGQIVHLADVEMPAMPSGSSQNTRRINWDSDIAVVGMSCKTAGAGNLEEFWHLLCAGKSQHKEVPKERFRFETAFREVDPDRKWFGNFMEDYDTFDHKFFKKSPRESATMDPQQRHILQIAYQAVEQSGYFHNPDINRHVGCYVGVCACDYENNIACHAPNAFTATGNLKSFIAGKVSHYFGWTGPGVVIDTACSSSAVAVHQACRAIMNGECNAALAGGTHVMTNPLWFQNLAGASFLSLTGQCKPFDAKADGYCRGEGVAAVFLKKLSAARVDGDQVLGIIPATAVQQNQNCTPVFVPNVPSLSDLFVSVINKAGLKPGQISVVEAHGTGTAVGDPVEYDSIRQIFGGTVRNKPLALSSVKGLIGHTECTSGIVSIIKILLMINKGMIPPQASFSTMNPAIKTSPTDQISIPRNLRAWDTSFRAALVNNYGASGSNASLIITQSTFLNSREPNVSAIQAPVGAKHPFWFCGLDDQSLCRYAKAFRQFLDRKSYSEKDLLLPNISFNLARQSNRLLDRALIFSVRSVDELKEKLEAFEKGNGSAASTISAAAKPVVLCFGGQVSTFVGLDEGLYKSVSLLRKHLDNVDAVACSLGAESIFPDIFKRIPIQDTVKLQVMLFALQYSCARSWIDSGIQPAALVGHSFGELTATCVSQILSLEDAVKMIINRATLVRDAWGSEKGAMMAIEAKLRDVNELLAETSNTFKAGKPASIACYNGPTSFTLAGSAAAIDAVVDTVSKSPVFSSMRSKKLNVTNAYHCSLLDHLLKRLEKGAQGLTFREPKVPLYRATEFVTQEKLTPKFVAEHMRSPVFFHHALDRIAEKYSSCVFLEAGSNSTVTSMASHALGNSSGSYFQAVSITSENAWNNLTDATMNLWKAGLDVHSWVHQASQINEYTPLLLPPYQFDKARHWTELKLVPKTEAIPATLQVAPGAEKLPDTLLTFVGYQDKQRHIAKFRVNTMISKYDKLVEGHVIAHTAPICPATVQLDLALEAIHSIRPDLTAAKLEPQIHGVNNQSPICINPSRFVWIEIDGDASADAGLWNFQLFSNASQESTVKTMHTSGRISFRCVDDLVFKLDFARLERLISHQRCLDLLQCNDAEDLIQGRNIYKTFAEVVDYGEEYRGLQKLVGRRNESAGYVVKKYNAESWLDPLLADNFCQVGGIFINCMTDRASTDIFIANGIEQWIRSPKLRQEDPRPDVFNVYATHHRVSDKAYLTDIFVFDALNGTLMEAILGISYVKISKVSMSKLLSHLTAADPKTNSTNSLPPFEVAKATTLTAVNTFADPSQPTVQVEAIETSRPLKLKKQPAQDDPNPKVKAILAELSGLELDEIKDDSELADLGIDSLMGREMAREIEAAFEIRLPEDDLMDITNIPGLIRCVRTAVGGDAGGVGETPESSAGESDDNGSNSSVCTSSDVETNVSSLAGELETNEVSSDLKIPFAMVLEAFNETKQLMDQRIFEYEQTKYVEVVMPLQTEMCISLTLDAFEQLGCSLRQAKPNETFARISHPKVYSRLVDYLYKMLEKESQIIIVNNETVTRTAVPCSSKSSAVMLQELLARFPDQDAANKLTFYTGSNLAQVLKGETDGIKLIFGTPEGRELVSRLYGDWPLNRLFYRQMEEFLSRLISKLDMDTQPLKILEMGAGTGGTTKWLLPLLAKLNVPVEYTFTDLGPSFLAAARKKFKSYPFMKFRVHDIEKPPTNDLVETQHVVIASNAVHATHSLGESTKNIRKFLRPDGFLMMLEMTDTLYWVDMIFGLLEGWWYFDDGRTHAVTHESRWEKDMHSVGYGHVDWTDGQRPENKVEKLIIAMASGSRYEKSPIYPSIRPVSSHSADYALRQAVVDGYVQKMTDGFVAAVDTLSSPGSSRKNPPSKSVLVTGASGSLGSHIVTTAALLPDVTSVICLNRRSKHCPRERQERSFVEKGIVFSKECADKVKVFEIESAKSHLGLSHDDYEFLLQNVTHIIHNAWLMNAKWPIKHFEPQMQTMHNLIELAREISSRRLPGTKITFQFISSIATTGHWPIFTGDKNVPEKRMPIEAVLPTGYGDAKYVCELMLDATLHKYPDRFRAMVVRPGQIASSSTSGYWNPMEHLSFLWKSSQTLKALPDFDGVLSWTPVDDVAATLIDLLLLPEEITPHPIYHIENPIRQPWRDMIRVLADALDVPSQNIVPFPEWVRRVRDHPRRIEGPEGENPAVLLIDFLDENFIRMSCGGLLLHTVNSRGHSKTLANLGPVSNHFVRLFVKRWKETGFLSE